MKILYASLIATVLLLNSCSKASQPSDPVPEHQSFTIDSKHTNEVRTINVWTPENYKTSSDSLMVLYMPDGGTKEDFPHIANTLNDLISANKIPNVILVGIENTQRRKDLTGPTTVETDKQVAPVVGGSAQFRDFIEQELIPEINKKYRTTDKKGIIGESLAGLFVVETFFIKPEIFDFYIAFDPSVWWNGKHLVKSASQYLDDFPMQQKTLWFAGSSASDISENVREINQILQSKNPENINWKYEDEKNEEHHTIFRATKEKALIWTLNNL